MRAIDIAECHQPGWSSTVNWRAVFLIMSLALNASCTQSKDHTTPEEHPVLVSALFERGGYNDLDQVWEANVTPKLAVYSNGTVIIRREDIHKWPICTYESYQISDEDVEELIGLIATAVRDPEFADCYSLSGATDDTTTSVIFVAGKSSIATSAYALHFDDNGIIDSPGRGSLPPSLENCYTFLGRLLYPTTAIVPWNPRAMRVRLVAAVKTQKSVPWHTSWPVRAEERRRREGSPDMEGTIPVTSYKQLEALIPDLRSRIGIVELNGSFWAVDGFAPEFPSASAWSKLLSQPTDQDSAITDGPWIFLDPPHFDSSAVEWKRRLHVDRPLPKVVPVPKPDASGTKP